MKKKITSLVIAFVMCFSSAYNAFADITSEDLTSSSSITKKADLKTSIIFSYPENLENFDSKNISVDLNLNGSKLLTLPITKEVFNSTYLVEDYYVEVIPTIQNNLISEVEITISDLARENGYDLTFSASGHKNYTTKKIDLSKSSQKVIIQTNNSTFTIGDVNNDGYVNSKDVQLLENSINQNLTQREYDLNGDGIVDINDIAFVNHHINTGGAEISGPYEYFFEEVISYSASEEELSKSGVTLNGGSISDLSDSTSTLTFISSNTISEETPLQIPIIFEEPIEMESVEITFPSNEGISSGYILVETEDGEEISVPVQKYATASLYRSSSETVTVSLGTKVAVKKVTITVTEVSNPDGSTDYVSLQEVKFLQDIGQDEAGTQTVTVNGVTYVEGDSEVTLSWNEVPNIVGYKVYYGTNENELNQKVVTDKTTVTISGLDNLTTYYFCVSAISDGYESNKSTVVSATPQPNSKPNKPDFLNIVEESDLTIKISWEASKNAASYNVYYKKETEDEYTLYKSGITTLNATINVNENNVVYDIYVTAVNAIGESEPSLTIQATPKPEEITPPTLPTKNKMDNSNILSVSLYHKDYYNKTLYPNGFDSNWVIDGDFTTSWVARNWWEQNDFIFLFDEPITSDYLILVPRLDGNYRKSLSGYRIAIWYDGDDLSSINADDASYVYKGSFDSSTLNDGYFILEFPKQENIKKISIYTSEFTGAPTRVNASEFVFYEYNDIPDRIEALFTDGSFTQLVPGVTETQINELIDELNDLDSFVISSDVLLNELEIAKGLLNNDTSVLGVIKDNLFSINPSSDTSNYNISINNFQPLGVVGKANSKVVIYADIPEGEKVTLVPTQYYEEATYLTGSSIELKNGRNVITIPKIGNRSNDRGGSLYVTYTGNNADKIKLQVVGGTKIPYLELNDIDSLDYSEISARISKFIDELEEHVPTLKGTLSINILNQCEISLPDVLLSLPANKILEGIKSGTTSREEQIRKVYTSTLAWSDLIDIIYKYYGIDDQKNNGLETRQNIRYMRMFGNAFMYASGSHIGIGYDSVSALVNGSPVSTLTETDTSNNLYGWGIAHEIGHVMDKLGKAEITNNIFSLAAQTYDGEDNTLPSRLETSNVYEQVYKKVSYVTEGLPNDVFVQLAMYWQLHLAYDDGKDNSFNFYNSVYKKYRENDSTISSLSGMDKFAVVASQVAEKDLTEFFTRWGVVLSDTAKNIIQGLGFETEERAIYYLNDESRRQRINENNGQISAEITASSVISAENEKQVNITITANGETSNILGYEILRNGTSIGFTTSNTYSDIIGSANNMGFTYSIVPINILGERQETISAGQVRIEYDKVVDPSLYNVEINDGVLTATFNSTQPVSGIILNSKNSSMPTSGTITVSIKTEIDGVIDESYTVARQIDFSNLVNVSSTDNKLLAYFNKPGVSSSDTRIWTYDAIEITIQGISNIDEIFDISFISYPGDNIELYDVAFGRIANDYVYGEDEDDVIEAGTLIIVGSYRGDPIYNTMRIEGRFLDESGLSEDYSTVERDINGYSLFFADVLENEISTTISDGIFIFVPDIQAEAALQNSSCDDISILPNQIRAVLYRSDDPYGEINNRVTSTTIWLTTPDIDTMPTIVIE